MIDVTRREILIAASCALASARGIGAPAPSEQEDFVAWAREAAKKLRTTDPAEQLDDLEPIREIVGDARVVGVGESFHGGREFLRMRHRVARFLIERMGFDTVALESGLPEGRLPYEYVLGGEAAPGLWEDGFTWTMADFPETRTLVEWMRAYNMRSAQKVRFYGMDVAGAKGSWLGAADQVFKYLDKVDPGWSTDMRARLTPLLMKFSRPGRTGLDFVASNEAFAKLPLNDRTAVAAYVNELFDRFENLRLSYLRVSTAEDYDWAHQIAYSLRAASNLVACYEAKDRPHATWNARDAEMAANVEWMRRRGSAKGGVVVLAHNGHVQRAVTTAADPSTANLGSYLRDRFADGYRALGFTFGSGTMPTETGTVKQLPPSDPQSLDGTLGRIGLPLSLIDLRGLPPAAPGAHWLGTPRKQRIQDFYAPYPELESWNGLFYIDRVNASSAAAR